MSTRNPSFRFKSQSPIFAVFAVTLLTIFASGLASAKGTPMMLCVNRAGSGGCSTTVQDAVSTVPAGGSAVITIAADVTPYSEDITVDNQTISFVGAGAGMTVIDGINGSNLSTFIFQNNSSGELHGLTIENGRGGEGSNVNFNQFGKNDKGVGTLKIENCLITGGQHPSNQLPNGAVTFAGKLLIVDSSSIVNNSDEGFQI